MSRGLGDVYKRQEHGILQEGQPRTIKITALLRMDTRKKAMPLLDGIQINMR